MALRVLPFVFLMVVAAGPLGTSQAPPKPRLGRPLDWSHAHVVASRGGPDGGRSIYRDWRTLLRHIEIDQAQASRKRGDARSDEKPRQNIGSLGLLACALFGASLFAEPIRRRRLICYLLLLSALVVMTLQVACGSEQELAPKRLSAVSSADVKLDWSLNTGGFGDVLSFPAKFSFDIAASNCSDVIYFAVDQAGGPSTVNLIAITNPYAGCPGNPTGSTPTVKFGIALPFPSAQLSPVLSLDGTILYSMEARPAASGGVILHAINVNNVTTNPGTYDFGAGAWTSVHTLAACPCGSGSEQLFELAFAGVDNVRSSPYLDYTTNQIFFGDALGGVHRIANANLSAASEDAMNFPISCGSVTLRDPVFVNNQVITASSDGRLYRIDVSGAPPYACIASANVGLGEGAGAGAGLTSAVIDVTNNRAIVVTGRDAASVWQMAAFDLNFTAGAAPLTSVVVGKENGRAPRLPAFDNAFLTTNTGNLYVGGTPTAGGNGYLIRVSYTSGSLGSAAGFAELHHPGGASTTQHSHVTAFLTASTLPNPEFVYIAGLKEYNFVNRIGSGFAGTDAAPVAVDSFFAGLGGVDGGIDSGIIIDNRTAIVTGSMATANIYYGTRAKPGTFQSTIVQLAQQF